MKILVLYGTKHGCTEKCAQQLSKKLEGTITVQNVKNGPIKDLESYDKIVVGSSIYAGMLHKGIKAFCLENTQLLKNKKTGYFICGMREGEEANQQLLMVYPTELLEHASAKEHFGGEVIFKKMGLLEKTIVKKVAKLDTDYSNILEDAMSRFAKKINEVE